MKWLVWGLSGGAGSGLAGTAIGAFTGNPLSGLVAGVVVGMLVLGGFAVKAINIAVSDTESVAASVANPEAATTPEAEKTLPAPAPTDPEENVAGPDAVTPGMIDRLKARIEELGADNERLQQFEQAFAEQVVLTEHLEVENKKKQEKLNRFDGDRIKFKELLTDARREGMNLRESGPSEDGVREWEDRVHDLLEDALGKDDYWAGRVLGDDPDFQSQFFGSSTAQKVLESHLNPLYNMIEWVKNQETIPFRRGFDPHDWKDWKSPPQDANQQRPGYWENRQMLHAALKDFYGDSIGLDDEDMYDDGEVKDWENRVTQLIEESLGQEEATRFLTNEDGISSTLTDASARHAWVRYRQFRLEVLIEVANSLSPLEIRPDFDGRKWVGSEQFRYKQGPGL